MDTVQIPGDILCPKTTCGYIAKMDGYVSVNTKSVKYSCQECGTKFSIILPRIQLEMEGE